MTDPKDTTQELQAQMLEGFRRSQEAVVEGMRAWTESVQRLVPGSAQSAWPRSEQLPTPIQVVDSVFDFAAQLLDAQRELAHSVLGAAAGIAERAQEQAQPAADTAKKTTKS
jgi:hypothetical protein